MSGRIYAVAISVLLVAYLFMAGARGVDLIRVGGAVPVALGAAILALPLIGAWIVMREWQFGRRTQALAVELEAVGGLPEDDLPRRPSGRVVRTAADARFEERRVEVEAAPEDWAAWFRLSTAYDDAGDRKRARAAMRKAILLHG